MGQIGAQQGKSPDVKGFGTRIAQDHGKALEELKQMALQKGLALPTELSSEEKKDSDHMKTMSGSAFDKMYRSVMVKDHEKDVNEFQKASQTAADADLRNWATKTLPTLQEHLKTAQALQKKVK